MTAARPAPPWLQLVTDRRRLCAAAGVPLGDAAALIVAQARAAASAGVSHFQVREPDLDGGALLALATGVRDVAGTRMRVLINDRVDVAVAAGVDAHLRAASLPASRLRSWVPAGLWLSQAVHSADEVRRAGPVDALVAGTVGPTPSKTAGHRVLGIDGLRTLVRATTTPVFAIGGLSALDWPALHQAGAAGLAAIGWFLPRRGESADEAVHRAAAEWAAVISS